MEFRGPCKASCNPVNLLDWNRIMRISSSFRALLIAGCMAACASESELHVYSTDQLDALPHRVKLGFDNDGVGRGPDGMMAAVGTWRVVEDSTARSGERVLAQEALSEDSVFNLVLADGPRLNDIDVSVQLRAIAGEVDQGGGLVWRAQDARNYYVARFNPLEDNYRVYFVKDGVREMLVSATVVLDGAAWHEVRVVMRGVQIECYLDGELYLEVRDTTFTEPGQFGLWTKADAQTHFDNLVVL